MKTIGELIKDNINTSTDELYILNPCKVIAVHNNFVDVLLYINDENPDFVIYNVPIIRPETQRAYIFLGIKEGDRGMCRFFDRSTEGYLQSDFDYNSDERQHDINDRCFELGFIPDAEAFVYPTDKEIEIGLKNTKFKLSVDNDGNINIVSAKDVTLNIDGNVTTTIKGNLTSTVQGNSSSTVNGTSTVICPTVNQTGNINLTGTLTVTGEVISNGIALSTHKHSDVQSGSDKTGAPTE